jgi:hypothetical protein
MNKQVFINIPVSDLEKSKAFYTALGFTNNPMFTDEQGAAMVWSEDIIFMLLTRDFYKKFVPGKEVIDQSKTSGVLIALNLESKEAVQEFADTAKANGGDYFVAEPNKDLDFMFGLEVTDLDGNQLEPVWMNPDFNPQA